MYTRLRAVGANGRLEKKKKTNAATGAEAALSWACETMTRMRTGGRKPTGEAFAD